MSHSTDPAAHRAAKLTHWTRLSMALSLGLSVAACGGGGGGEGSGGGDFQLIAIGSPAGELSNGAEWEINRPIEFEFTEPVDFSTVNATSINILTQVGAIGALGEFRTKLDADGDVLENIVVWQPRCPLQPDLSDAGLTPGGTEYRILVNGADSTSSLSVRSKAGSVLGISQNRTFFTPTSLAPADLFFDPVSGPPDVLIQNEAQTNLVFSFLETLVEDEFGALIPQANPFLIDDLGQPVLIPNVPINLFSAADQRLSVVLEFNQPVNPSAQNISSDRLGLQFRDVDSGQWIDIQTTVELEANCTSTGGRVRISPVSILPQASELRVSVDSSFEDLVGQVNSLSLEGFSKLETISDVNPLFTPAGNLGDEIFEPFLIGAPNPTSFEEPEPEFAEPIANWSGGQLSPNFNFLGTGGPGGTFDWVVAQDTTVLFSTSSQEVEGGPDGSTSTEVTFVDGLVNVRNLTIAPNATVIVTGPNPLRIFATGEVQILGRLVVNGTNAPDVVQLATPTIPKSGGPGNAAGGRGGLGTPSTTQSSAVGGIGFGPFVQAGGGGRGGESSFGTNQPEKQRPGGGGGGTFAVRHNIQSGNDDQLLVTDFLNQNGPGVVPETGTPGQQNLASVRGSDGINNSTSAVTKSQVALGGEVGPARFVNSNPNDDFWGVRLTGENNDVIVRGELSQPSAGSGGGGGGDVIVDQEFPQVPWNKQAWKNEWSGSGGGGGGGQLQIFAIGPIRFIERGKILARGGAGGRGESIAGGINNTAGGGGGGSGGHVILQSASAIDFSASTEGVTGTGAIQNADKNRGILAINALGGDGGPGGDFNPDGSGDFYNQGGYVNSLVVPNSPNQSPDNKPNAGGAGGAGVVQLHVPAPIEENLILPGSAPVTAVVQPAPYLLEPSFGAVSKARTIPIPLSGALDNPNSSLSQVLFAFDGTDSAVEIQDPDEPGDPEALIPNPDAGEVLRNLEQVQDLPPVLSGSAVSIDSVARTVRIDASSLLTDPADPISDDIYLRNPSLLRQFALDLTTGGLTARYDVASASFDEAELELVLTLGPNPQSLASFVSGDSYELLPRFFRVRTNGVVDSLPSTAAVRFRFQGLSADFEGAPVLDAPLVDWTPDVMELNNPDLGSPVSFVRIEATFDIADGDTELSNLNARPVLDFFRLPFLF